MPEAFPKLKNAPIVEAVFDVDCSLPPSFELASLEAPARQLYEDNYPDPRTQFVQEFRIQTAREGASNASIRPVGVQALQFRSQDQKQIVQVRAQGFSFNRLAPYTTLDDYLPEMERTWRMYVSLVSPIQIRAIRLRYINRILLPYTGSDIDLTEFFKIAPRVPDEKGLFLTGFLSQQSGVERDSGRDVSLVLTSQPIVGDKGPFILDITVGESIDGADPGDWSRIRSSIDALRTLKNRMFHNSLTTKCIELFQQ